MFIFRECVISIHTCGGPQGQTDNTCEVRLGEKRFDGHCQQVSSMQIHVM